MVGEVKDLETRAWNLRNHLLLCQLAQQNLDCDHLSNEAAWVAYLQERGIGAREVKGVGPAEEEPPK